LNNTISNHQGNANETTMKCLLVLSQNSSYQKKKTTHVGMWRKENTYTAVKDVNLCSHYGNNTEVSKKLKREPHEIYTFHAWAFLQQYWKEDDKGITCTPAFIRASFSIIKMWKNLCVFQWIKNKRKCNRISFILKRRKSCHLGQHGWMWRALYQVTQTRYKGNWLWSQLYIRSETVQFIEGEGKWLSPGLLGEGDQGVTTLVTQDGKAWRSSVEHGGYQ
jgi:hypothetical protein